MKVGKYSIPDLRLFPNIHDDVKLIYENYRLEEVKDEDTVAKLIGHKRASGGYWLSKKADMRLYGLMERRGFKLTRLAERLTYGQPQEKQDAIKEAVLNVSLWKELYSTFKGELPDSNFWVQVQKITGLDPLEAQKHAETIRKAYLDDVSHIKPEIEEIIEVESKGVGGIDISNTIPEGVIGRVIVEDTGYIDVKDRTTYEIAKAYLKLFAEKLGITEEDG